MTALDRAASYRAGGRCGNSEARKRTIAAGARGLAASALVFAITGTGE
jgi:hypothetical protein